jgi:hypothetical protein
MRRKHYFHILDLLLLVGVSIVCLLLAAPHTHTHSHNGVSGLGFQYGSVIRKFYVTCHLLCRTLFASTSHAICLSGVFPVKTFTCGLKYRNLIKIILVRHTSYNEDDLEAPSSVINK